MRSEWLTWEDTLRGGTDGLNSKCGKNPQGPNCN